jgi:hypothetical protein
LLCGLRVFTLLMQVAFESGVGLGKVFLDQFTGESTPGGKETSFDGCQPGGGRWAEATFVEITD